MYVNYSNYLHKLNLCILICIMLNECVNLVYNRLKEEPNMLQPRLTVKKPDGSCKRCYWNLQTKTIECEPGLSHKIMHLSLLFGLFLVGLIAAPTVAAAQRNGTIQIIKILYLVLLYSSRNIYMKSICRL